MKRKLIILSVLVVVFVAGIFLIKRYSIKKTQQNVLNQIASAVSGELGVGSGVISDGTKLPTPDALHPTDLIPTELNLKVPFTSQAPTGLWDDQHEENCEEAAILMASRYFQNKPIESAKEADDAMDQLVDWENANLGVSDSLLAAQSAKVITNFLNLKAELVNNPTIDQIKSAIASNKLVLVPAAGRELGNPFYTAPGPLYHMLLIKGYTASQFITNDAGTKHGENFPYDFKTILDANHDWNGSDVNNGAHVVIVVYD